MSYIMKVRLELTLFLSVCVWVRMWFGWGRLNGVACVCWAGMPLLCLLHSSLIVICWIPVFCGPACLLFFFLSLYRVKVSDHALYQLKKINLPQETCTFYGYKKVPVLHFIPLLSFPASPLSLKHHYDISRYTYIYKCYSGLITCFWRNM